MSIKPNEVVTKVIPVRHEGRWLDRLRIAALVVALVGTVGSVGLFLRASQRTPRLLLVIMAIWVFSPFVALVWANVVSKRWSALTRTTLYCVMLVITLASLAIYADDALGHRRPQAAFVYVMVPPVSWLLIAVVVPLAAFISGRQSHQGDGV